MIDLARRDGENESQYLWRLGDAKDCGLHDLDWNDIAALINREFRADETEYRTEAAYRKQYTQAKKFVTDGVLDLKRDGAGAEGDVQEQLIELRKLRQQISDERVDYQRTVREQARRDSFVDLVRRAMKADVRPFVDRYDAPVIDSDSDMVVMLSDLHAGIEIDNVWNRYNTAIMQERLEKYLCEVRKIQTEHKCKVCEFVLLGDLISGLIHRNLRLENNENVIEQVKIVSVCIGEFVKRLSEMFETVRVHAVSGNHSRITPSKDEHLKGEELDDLVEFYLGLMFENVSNVKFGDDRYG